MVFGRMVGRWSSVVEWLRTLDQYDVRRTTYSEYVELHAEASSSVPKHRVVFSIATLSTQSHGSGKRTPVSRPPFRECLWEESPTGPRGRSSGSDHLPANRPAEGVTFKLQVGDGFSGAGCPQENRQLPRHVVRVRLTECGFRTLNCSRGQRFNLNNLIKCFLLEHVSAFILGPKVVTVVLTVA